MFIKYTTRFLSVNQRNSPDGIGRIKKRVVHHDPKARDYNNLFVFEW